MHPISRLSFFTLLLITFIGGAGAANAAAVAEGGQRCGSAPTDYTCTFDMPRDLTDPRIGPVEMYDWDVVCTATPNVLAMGRVDPLTGFNTYREVLSPSACNGEESEILGIELPVDIDPQRSPREGLTVIAFLYDDGAKMHTGVCTSDVNLAVFTNSPTTGELELTAYSAPEWCSATP